MKIRKATLNDVEQIVQVHVQTWKVSYRGYIKDAILDSGAYEVSEKRITKMKAPVEKGLVFVAEEKGMVKGFIGLNEFEGNCAEIKVFYVLPDCQRNGFGKALLFYVKEFLKSQGVKKINLFTLENYPISNHFYQKHGFKLTENRQYLEWLDAFVQEYEISL